MDKSSHRLPDPQSLSRQQWDTKTPPVVSVLCFAYNHERYLAQCLDQILAQVTDFPVEIIVHDDASTDGTVDIIRSYERRFPHIMRPLLQQENQYSRRRKVRPMLLQMAQGAYIASCDGDDFWQDPFKLAKQVDFLDRNPEYVLSFHGATQVDAQGRTMGKDLQTAGKLRDYSSRELRTEWAGMLTGTVLARNVELDFPPEYYLVPNGDVFLPLLLARYGAAKCQADILPLAYRQHANGIWSSMSAETKASTSLQSYLQITCYLVRTGEPEVASTFIRHKLAGRIRRYLRMHRGRWRWPDRIRQMITPF